MKRIDTDSDRLEDSPKFTDIDENANIKLPDPTIINENILSREVEPFLQKIRKEDPRQADKHDGDDYHDFWSQNSISYFEKVEPVKPQGLTFQ